MRTNGGHPILFLSICGLGSWGSWGQAFLIVVFLQKVFLQKVTKVTKGLYSSAPWIPAGGDIKLLYLLVISPSPRSTAFFLQKVPKVTKFLMAGWHYPSGLLLPARGRTSAKL